MYKIYVNNKQDREKYTSLSASMRDIRRELGCSRATAYKLLRKYACAVIVDVERGRSYQVIPIWDLERIKSWYFEERRGNPNFHDSAYQSELARRPRSRKWYR